MQKMYLILVSSFGRFRWLSISKSLFLLAAFVVMTQLTMGAVINVPADQPTIQAAVNAAAAGDSILVAAGMYNESVDLSNAAADLTIYTTADATVNGGDAPAFLANDRTGDITISGFSLTSTLNDGTDAGVIQIFNLDGRLTVKNNNFVTDGQFFTSGVFHKNTTEGLALQSSILNNTFGNFDNDELIFIEAGLQGVGGDADILVDRNTNTGVLEDDAIEIDLEASNSQAVVVITNNLFRGWTASGEGVDLHLGNAGVENLEVHFVVANNQIIENHQESIEVIMNGTGTKVFGEITNNTVTGDPVHTDNGIEIKDNANGSGIETTIFITRNTIINTADSGIKIAPFNSGDDLHKVNLVIVGNTISNPNADMDPVGFEEAAIDISDDQIAGGTNFTLNVEITNNTIQSINAVTACILVEATEGEDVNYLIAGNLGCETPIIRGEPNATDDPVPATEALGSISGIAWNDANKDGSFSIEEFLVEGVQIDFTDGTFSGSTFTNANGRYTIPALSAGTYTLTVIPTDALPFVTIPNAGGVDSDFDPETKQASVILEAGRAIDNIRVGLLAEELVSCPTITFTAEATAPDCPGGNDGAITISGEMGDTGPYMYSIDGGATYQESEVFAGLETGTYTVRIKDANECESEDVSIEVEEGEDTEVPVALCKDFNIILGASGEVAVGNLTFDSGSSDNCGMVIFEPSQSLFTCEDIGVTEVVLTVSDESGNTSTCISTVTVQENPDFPCESGEIAPITEVFLAFLSDSAEVFAQAIDPDGDGPAGLEVISDLQLEPNTEYLALVVALNIVGEDTIDVTDQIFEDAGDDYITYYGWTEGLFTDPEGDGNIDNPSDPVNYLDFDDNFLPLGFFTGWITGEELSGTFRVLLKDLQGSPKDSASAESGETVFDLTFNLRTTTNIIPYSESKQSFNVWPNPAQGKFQWEINQATEPIEEIVIFDKIGRQVAKIVQPSISVDISELPAGTYSVFANSKNKRWVQRLVITK